MTKDYMNIDSKEPKMPTWEEFKEAKRLWCRLCKKEMKDVGIGGSDIFGLMMGGTAHYCENPKCKRYGDLTVAGIKNL